MRNLFLILFLLIFVFSCYSQSTTKNSYPKAKIYLENHRILTVKKLEINSSNVSFLNVANKEQQNLLMEKVNFIKVPKGNHLLEGSLYGGATMALTALLVDVQTDPLGRDQKLGADAYAGLTLGGAVIGALIGSAFPKWKEVYSKGNLMTRNPPINLAYDSQNDQIVIKITLSL